MLGARVLVVDADPSERVQLARLVATAGHQVDAAATAAAGLKLARAEQPALVIVDSSLPDGSADTVCRAIRADRATANMLVFVLSAPDEAARVAAFEAGADDLVAKPFSARELTLRLSALLRRRRRPRADAQLVAIGTLTIDPAARRAAIGEAPLVLTRREFDLLLVLAQGRGRVHTREAIVRKLWPSDLDGDSGRVVDTTVKRLRKKLGPAARTIQTVRGAGYRLADVVDGSADERDTREEQRERDAGGEAAHPAHTSAGVNGAPPLVD